MKVLVRTPYPISLLTRTYIGQQAELYGSTQRSILVTEATYIGSPSDLYSFAPPSPMAISQYLSEKTKKPPRRRSAGRPIMRSPVLRSRGLRRAGDTTPI